jgi:hypothetical protein
VPDAHTQLVLLESAECLAHERFVQLSAVPLIVCCPSVGEHGEHTNMKNNVEVGVMLDSSNNVMVSRPKKQDRCPWGRRPFLAGHHPKSFLVTRASQNDPE